eukprot:TRINITY_DN2327_c3_g2_i1.p1 TRINITY_DN2327_c3_g2~~TRINITY_DN2327_c3_g2_i1.p1  ORF type:complete len:631 (+),score=245.03 TRINITY_DN2327_c3_g2_i1:70-1893(+)
MDALLGVASGSLEGGSPDWTDEPGRYSPRRRLPADPAARGQAVLLALQDLRAKKQRREAEERHWEEMYRRERRRAEEWRAESEAQFREKLDAERERAARAEVDLRRLRDDLPVIEAETRAVRDRLSQREREAAAVSADAREALRRATTERALVREEVSDFGKQRDEVLRQTAAEEALHREAAAELERCQAALREFAGFNWQYYEKLSSLAGQLRSGRAPSKKRGRAGSRRRSQSAATQPDGAATAPVRASRRHLSDAPPPAATAPCLYATQTESSMNRLREREKVEARRREEQRRRQDAWTCAQVPTVHHKLRRIAGGDVPFFPPGAAQSFNQLARVQQGLHIANRPTADAPADAPRAESPARSPRQARLPPPPPPPPPPPHARAAPATRELTVVRDSPGGGPVLQPLGLTYEDQPDRGVVVTASIPGYAAARAGVAVGHEIVAVNGARVRNRRAADTALATAPRTFTMIVADEDTGFAQRPFTPPPPQSPRRAPPASPPLSPRAPSEGLRARLQAEQCALRDRIRDEMGLLKQGAPTDRSAVELHRLHGQLDRVTEELALLDHYQEAARTELREGWRGPSPTAVRENLHRRQKVLSLYSASRKGAA